MEESARVYATAGDQTAYEFTLKGILSLIESGDFVNSDYVLEDQEYYQNLLNEATDDEEDE